jgi:predicted Fe-Mo cluster-binding NifX family protein
MKLAISAVGPNPTDPVDPRFGRARYFLLYDTESEVYTVIDNADQVAAMQGAGIQAAQNVTASGVEALLTGRCGPKAFQVLEAAGVQIFGGVQGSVQQALQAWRENKLQRLDGPTGRPHH